MTIIEELARFATEIIDKLTQIPQRCRLLDHAQARLRNARQSWPEHLMLCAAHIDAYPVDEADDENIRKFKFQFSNVQPKNETAVDLKYGLK